MRKTHTSTRVPETFVDADGKHHSDMVLVRDDDETYRLKTLVETLDPTKVFTVMRNIRIKAPRNGPVVHELQAIRVECTSMKEAGFIADAVKASRDVPLPMGAH